MRPRVDDIFVCTYPKSGTTWIQHIVHQLLGKNDYESVKGITMNTSTDSGIQDEKNSLFFVSPMIERVGSASLDQLKSPRVLKSHFNYHDIPKGCGAKYIYSCRNPKDCLNSFFHHHRRIKSFDFKNGHFDVFFKLFMKGHVPNGSYFDHLNSWLEGIEKGEEIILFLKYEDMVADLKSAVVKIGKFLGGNAAEIIKDEEKLSKIVESSSFSAMKKCPEIFFPSIPNNEGEFFRKGGSRDWKNQFTFEQSNRMDMLFRERCTGTAASEWWQAEMDWNGDESTPRSVSSIYTR